MSSPDLLTTTFIEDSTIPQEFTIAGTKLTFTQIKSSEFPATATWLPNLGTTTCYLHPYCPGCEEGNGGWYKLIARPDVFAKTVITTKRTIIDLNSFHMISSSIFYMLAFGAWSTSRLQSTTIQYCQQAQIAYKGPSDLDLESKENGLACLPGENKLEVVSPLLSGFLYGSDCGSAFIYPDIILPKDITPETSGIAVRIRPANIELADFSAINYFFG